MIGKVVSLYSPGWRGECEHGWPAVPVGPWFYEVSDDSHLILLISKKQNHLEQFNKPSQRLGIPNQNDSMRSLSLENPGKMSSPGRGAISVLQWTTHYLLCAWIAWESWGVEWERGRNRGLDSRESKQGEEVQPVSTGEVTGISINLLALPEPSLSFVVLASFLPQLKCPHDFVHMQTSRKCLVAHALWSLLWERLFTNYNCFHMQRD